MEEDILKYLPTVMFRGTPCTSFLIFQKPGADQLQGEYAKNIGELKGLLTYFKILQKYNN